MDQQGAAAASGHFYSDTPQAGPPHQSRERTHCWPLWPPLSPALVLVTLLVLGGRYLFLHQPQLITQVAVGFHKVLDLGFWGREGVLHLHVFLHSNGAVWEVRVKALLKRVVKRWNARTGRLCLTWSTPVIPWSCPLCWTGGLDLYPHQMPHCRSPAGRCPGYRYSACQPHSSGWIQHCLVTQSRNVITYLCNSSVSGRAWNDETRCWPLGLASEFPCCLRLASLNMSITRVANSCALNLASFCRPWTRKSKS